MSAQPSDLLSSAVTRVSSFVDGSWPEVSVRGCTRKLTFRKHLARPLT